MYLKACGQCLEVWSGHESQTVSLHGIRAKGQMIQECHMQQFGWISSRVHVKVVLPASEIVRRGAVGRVDGPKCGFVRNMTSADVD